MTFTPGNLAAFEAAIISACEKHENDHGNDLDYKPCVVAEGVFIKFDDYEILYPQFQTQEYIFQCAKGNVSAPHIPKILHFFHRDYEMAYMVMEYIKLVPPPVPDLPQKAAMAIQWLRDLPVPSDRVRIGPLGSGSAWHMLFKDCEAPLDFSSIQAIERYLNKAITRLPPGPRPVAPVNLCHEQLVFTQSNMDESNFGVDDEGRTCLLGFGGVGLLPESFASYTVSMSARFTVAVAQHLSWPSSSNLITMFKATGCLWMIADPTLGLDDNGYPTGETA